MAPVGGALIHIQKLRDMRITVTTNNHIMTHQSKCHLKKWIFVFKRQLNDFLFWLIIKLCYQTKNGGVG